MSKRKNGNRLPPFVFITKEMLKSKAFKELTNASRIAYLLFRSQISKIDQNEVIFPYSQAEEYMNRHTFARSVKQLIEKGFIVKSQMGGMYRRTNSYVFSDQWRPQNHL